MKLLLLFLILNISQVFANEFTIVAVGQAEQEKEKFAFVNPNVQTLSDEQKKIVTSVATIIKEDFKFYKHLYEVNDEFVSIDPKKSYSSWKKEGLNILVVLVGVVRENALYLDLKLFHTQKESLLLSTSEKVITNNIRSFSHKLANDIYKSLNGKDSIFTKKIVFLSDRTSKKNDVRKEVYLMDFDGKRVQRLTYNNAMIISPAVSPDNKKIMFSMYQGRWRRSSRGVVHKVKNLNLYMYDMETRKTTKVSGKKGINSGAIFTQDPNQIYLTLSLAKNADIYRMDLDTKKLFRATNHMSDDVDPHINADGSLMTFLSGRPGKAMIYTMDPNSIEKDVKRISFVGRFNASPRFSPDGKEIVFSSWVDNCFDIYKIDSDGKNLVRLTKNFGSNEEPMFSPDGQFIVFTSQRVISRKKAVQDVYIMNREGEILSKLTKNFGKTFTPRWTN